MKTPLSVSRFNPLLLASALVLNGAFHCTAQMGGAATGAATTATDTNAPTEPRPNTAIIPKLNPGFMKSHTNFVEIAKKGDINVLFMGDSITDWWRSAPPNGGKNVFDKYFGDWKVANFGIAGDTTQGVLWRLKNGEGEGYKPKAVMLMIGTNNTSGRGNTPNTAPEIAEGVEAVVAELRKDFPDAKILLLAIFPRSTPGAAVRAKLAEVNQRIAKLHDGKNVVYMDINSKFLDADGNFLPGVFRQDNLHPAEKGYEIWADAVKEPLANLMK